MKALVPERALYSVEEACHFLGGISRSAYYERVLPNVSAEQTVRIGQRRFVTAEGLREFIARGGTA